MTDFTDFTLVGVDVTVPTDVHPFGTVVLNRFRNTDRLAGDERIPEEALPQIGELVIGRNTLTGSGPYTIMGKVARIDLGDRSLPIAVTIDRILDGILDGQVSRGIDQSIEALRERYPQGVWVNEWARVVSALPDPAEPKDEATVLRDRVASLLGELEAKDRRHREALESIGVTMREYAQRHGWCEVAVEAAQEAGVPWPMTEARFTVTITVPVVARRTNHRCEEPDESFVERSVILSKDEFDNGEEDTNGLGIYLDSDWTDVSVGDPVAAVSGLEVGTIFE